jgi:hypothetical protein
VGFATLTELTGAVADWLDRSDLDVRIPDFIALAEAWLNRTLRVQDMSVYVSGQSDQGRVALPLDFLEAQRVSVDGAELRFVALTDVPGFRKYAQQNGITNVGGYTIQGYALELVPAPSAVVTVDIVYYQRIPSLMTAAGGTNWLLKNHPDVYLYGTLAQSAPFLKDPERLQQWSQLLGAAVASLSQASAHVAHSGSKLGTQAPRTFG